MALLGLAAFDPVGIGLIIVLLTQKRPIKRGVIFLFGSAVALTAMGLLFARGFGSIIIKAEDGHKWIVPAFQLFIGIALLGFGLYSLKNRDKTTKPKRLLRYINVNDFFLFSYGFLLVTIQSLLDGVFIIAMIHAGQLHLSNIRLLSGVLTYTLAALIIQVAIIVIFIITPRSKRRHVLNTSDKLLSQYGNKLACNISLILGSLLIINAILFVLHKPHL